MIKVDLNNVQGAFAHKSNGNLRESLFIYRLIQYPWLVRQLTSLANLILKYKFPLKFLLKKTIFKQFCAGENRIEAARTMADLKVHGVGTVLDYVAEGDNSEASFEKNLHTILTNIQFVSEQSNDAFVGVKLSGLEDVEFIKEVNDCQENLENAKQVRFMAFVQRVNQICALAQEKNVKVYFDAEEKSTQDVYDHVVEDMMSKYNVKNVLVYNTVQMYFKDRLSYLETVIQRAKAEGHLIGMKLVRGAYVEKERYQAIQKGLEIPVFDTKKETDEAFNKAVELCLMEYETVSTCLATHNQESVEKALALIEKYQIKDHYNKVYFSQLFGMSDNLTFNLAKYHFNASKYVPYGELEKAIPYLLRRAEENTSMEGQVSREYDLLLKEKKRRLG